MQANLQQTKIGRLTLIITRVADMYFFALKRIDMQEVARDSKRSIDDYKLYVVRVRRAFNRLASVEQKCINNDFFYQDYPNWWKKKYSRSSYYRLRKRSMINFKEALEHEF